MRRLPGGSAVFRELRTTVAVIVAVLIASTAITGYAWASTDVTLVIDGVASTHVAQRDDTVASLLSREGVAVDVGDIVTPPLHESLRSAAVVRIRRSVPVTIRAGSTTVPLRVVGSTVADALVLAGFDPASGTRVSPPAETPLAAGMTITVSDVFLRVIQQSTPVPFKTVRRADPALAQGMTVLARKGVAGRRMRVYTALVSGGREGVRRLAADRVVVDPVSRVIAVGTKRSPKVGRVIKAVSVSRLVAHRGAKLRVVATGYTPGHDCGRITATGTIARYGVIAVDPRVIPLGSRVFVPGYGYAIAGDTGGAIDGRRIDLCFDTLRAARAWGRRTVDITVLR